MHYFRYKRNRLYGEHVLLERIVQHVGSPCYVYSYRTLVEHYRKLRDAFKSIDPLICYSVKANSNLALLQVLKNEGAGFDVVSGGELFRALKVCANPKKIVFAGVGKTDREIRQAIQAGILFFNVESEQELERIQYLAVRMRKTVNICLRVNPTVDPDTHSYIKTAKKESKFGLHFETARQLLLNRDRFFNLRIQGLHIHIGSQITQTKPYVEALSKVATFMKQLQESGVSLEYLNIGGGMGIVYKEEPARTAQQFARALLPILKKLNVRVIFEPGRFIVGSAGVLLARATYIKESGGKRFAIMDCGMNDLLRPSLYDAYHEIFPLGKYPDERQYTYDVVGPICESGDFIAKDRTMPHLHQGEYAAILCAGAYGFSMSSNYNSRPRAAEVLVRGRDYYVIRQREHYGDLIKGERIPRFL